MAGADRIPTFLSIGARLAGVAEGDALSLGHLALGLPMAGGTTLGGRSELNNDGDPLQICLTSSESGVNVRLIADPCWQRGIASERLVGSRAALAEVLRAQPTGLGPWCDALLKAAIPEDAETTNRFRRGFCWIGTGVGITWLGLYVDAKPQGTSRWEIAREWLVRELSDSRIAVAFLDRLAEYGDIASFAIEGAAPDAVTLKIYWRLRSPRALSETGLDLLQDPAFKIYLAQAVGARPMRLSGTVFSAGFDTTGAISSAKIDLCAHCLPQEADRWISTVNSLTGRFGLTPMPVGEDLMTGRCDAAFLGLGLDARRRPRLNLYLKPPGRKRTRQASEAAKERIREAILYLTELQRPGGSWCDYRLPAGEATQWVTAFTGVALASAARKGYREAIGPARRAAVWLDRVRTYPAGWGYNDRTGADADSTGLVLRLFHALGKEVQSSDERFLLGQWRPGGGFATYNEPGYWAAVHPCVTSVAYLGLSPDVRMRLLPDLKQYLSRTIRQDGTWPSYWWRNHLYSTFHHRFLLRQLGLSDRYAEPAPLRDPGDEASAFEVAHAAGIGYLRQSPGQQARELIDRLLNMQKQDGSWEGGFNLRVTEPDCAQPWDDPRGTLYADEYGTITTASAITVLLEVSDVQLCTR
ncbi:MAG TPA: hypothetical protein VK752_11395 [Bryobacteraceae bacterium]|jgi:hypothetical protein|nr:hypothetical protein [Bryobacteraceae bacterium]